MNQEWIENCNLKNDVIVKSCSIRFFFDSFISNGSKVDRELQEN